MSPTRAFVDRLHARTQAFWAVHPYASSRVYIGDVNVTAPRDEGIPNDDGIDPDSCGDVLVERAYVSVGDNSVAIKSGMNLAGRTFAHPSFNLVFRDSVRGVLCFASPPTNHIAIASTTSSSSQHSTLITPYAHSTWRNPLCCTHQRPTAGVCIGDVCSRV